MPDIFVSYTSSDREWAFWLGQELELLGHTPHLHEWEVEGGGDIAGWMEERHDKADRVLCVVSKNYLKAPYSNWERRAAQWAAQSKRPNFMVPLLVEDCELPTLFAHVKHCNLAGLGEDAARERLSAFMAPASRPSGPMRFPGVPKAAAGAEAARAPVVFPGRAVVSAEAPKPSGALTNIPVSVPRHFLGRNDSLAEIRSELTKGDGRAAITALYGLRGVGKTTVAAAYAEKHRDDYRATWWISAQTESGMRADLVALGVRLGWVAADEKEEPALAIVMQRLRDEGEGTLLIYDNAVAPGDVRPYLPRGGKAHVLITSNAPNWRNLASPVSIRVWPKEIGADYLTAGTRSLDLESALALSAALGGLPLAHEQAAAYCERTGVSLGGYRARLEAMPSPLLDDHRDAPSEYGRTVAKTFSLAIEEASKLHPAAEALITHAALLAPEPIPLFLFSEGREHFGTALSDLTDAGLDDAVAALRAFALVDRESIPDERDPSITTDCIRLHRLIREVARGQTHTDKTRSLLRAMAAIYPGDASEPLSWVRTRRLDAIALALVGENAPLTGDETEASFLLHSLAIYRLVALAAHDQARTLVERAIALTEKVFGPNSSSTVVSLNNLAYVLQTQGDLAGARPLFERAVAIHEKELGPEHLALATSLNNLASLLLEQGNASEARPLLERALAIRTKASDNEDHETVTILNNLAGVLQKQGDLKQALPLFERALAACENLLGREHPHTAATLNNLATILQEQGNLSRARPLLERALAIDEKAFGLDHPDVATDLINLGRLLMSDGELEGARVLFERALSIDEKALGSNHPSTNVDRGNLAILLVKLGEFTRALKLSEEALERHTVSLGSTHPWTQVSASVVSTVLSALGRHEEALTIRSEYGVESY